jgi:hypothetical protein
MRALFLTGCLMGGLAAAAEPDLQYVYPAGGCPGSEFEIEAGGVMSAVTHAVFSGEGVKATLIGAPREVTYSKKGKPVVTLVPNRYRFKVTVEKEAKPGLYAFRVATAYRLSEPLSVEISALPQVCEAATNRAVDAETVLESLPVCLNGRIRKAGTDRYRFQAARGMALVAFAEGRVLPRDDFRPVLTFTDASGQPCEGVTVYDAGRAPVAVFEVPQDGTYVLSVAAASGKGSSGSVYRIKLGELPLATGFAPAGAKAGESLNVSLSGYNLPQRRVRLFTGGKNSELCLDALVGEALALPGLRFDLSEEADVAEREPNDAAEAAQALAVPGVVNAVLETAGGRDVYRISGQAGETLYADVRAESLGSPLRARVTVRDVRNATLAQGCFDTNATALAALCGRDPSVAVTLPEEGVCLIEVDDLAGRGGDAFTYRLRVGPPQPDYRLWMTPASLNIPSAGSELVTLYLHRIHGFNGEVRVGLDFPPLSIACEGGLLPAGAVTAKMTVSTDGVRFPRTAFGLSLTGLATIGDREVRRPALPAVFRWDSEGRVTREVYGEVSAKVGYGAHALRIDPEGPYGFPPDSRVPTPVAFKVPVAVSAREPARLKVLSATMATHLGGLYVPTVVWPPQGFSVTGVQPTNKQERAGVLLWADPKVMTQGQTGFFILGCHARGDTNRPLAAVTQSVPYLVR